MTTRHHSDSFEDLERAASVLGIGEAEYRRIADEARREAVGEPQKDETWVVDRIKRHLTSEFCSR